MNILIISKAFHQKNDAISIQVKRLVLALNKYTDLNIVLITEGIDNNEVTSKLKIVNLKPSKSRFPFTAWIIDRIVCSPYCFQRTNFIKKGYSSALILIPQNKIDLLVTISTPFESHIVGLRLKRKFRNLKWVTIFSDMWPHAFLPKPYKRKKILSKIETNLMSKVLKTCNAFLTPSKYTIELVQQNFNPVVKLCCIPLCSDNESFNIDNQLKGYIVHSGSLQKERVRKDLIDALNELELENKSFKGLIQIGMFCPKFKHLIKKSNCKSIITIEKVPVDIANKIQSLFEIGLIVEAPFKSINPFMPSKITDSIKLNRKLIVITPQKSFLSEFALNHKGIFCCQYEKESIKQCIKKALNSPEIITDTTINYFQPANIADLYNCFFNSIVFE